MTLLRDGFDGLPGGGIRLRMWSGAGAAAGALIEKMELKKRHWPTNFKVKTQHAGDEQKWAHAAFHAGHIECLQQGYAPEQKLHKLDIVGAYPWGCIALPSMRDSEYETVKVPLYKIEQTNILSMFKVVWRFPETITRRGVIIPLRLFPLPYRSKKLHGAILYPAIGRGIYFRDDVVHALKWIEASGLRYGKDYEFIVEEAMMFHPGNDEMPFQGDNAMGIGVVDIYEQRRLIKEVNPDDIREKTYKLPLNSLYGKFAQRIGGDGFNPPPTANPWWAGAITASCRRRVGEAVLSEPGAITDGGLVVGFMTDGIVTTRPLTRLERVKEKANKGERKELGDWEHEVVTGMMSLQSGFYTDSSQTNMRGTARLSSAGRMTTCMNY